jgi:trehalose synthase
VTPLKRVDIDAAPPERFRQILGDRFEEVAQAVTESREVFAGRVVWHINSTARGGGVAELLQTLLAYARGAGVDARWAVIAGEPEYFAITKRIHNLLHGSAGDGGELGASERAIYERTLASQTDGLAALVRERDIVYLHDPQTAGMVPRLLETGAAVVWRCHVGTDQPNELARAAWSFLLPYLDGCDAYVFSRSEFVWDGLSREDVWIVPPSIDAFSPKNQELEEVNVRSILRRIGLSDGSGADRAYFVRYDGTPGRVDSSAEILQDALVPEDAELVTQVSRWDRLKDPLGVMRGFADHVAAGRSAHLLLAGPDVSAVADDPEGAEVLAEVIAERESLPAAVRERVHVATLPMADLQENAAMVNAIQRRSDIVVQKSLAEGFGLTVAEAMWKGRPVVASRRGGIQDQIEDGVSGMLVADPADLGEYGRVLGELLDDAPRREAMGAAARARVEDHFLGTRHLLQYFGLLRDLLQRQADAGK